MQWKIPKHMALQVRPDPHTCVSARVQSTMFIFRKVVGLKKKKFRQQFPAVTFDLHVSKAGPLQTKRCIQHCWQLVTDPGCIQKENIQPFRTSLCCSVKLTLNIFQAIKVAHTPQSKGPLFTAQNFLPQADLGQVPGPPCPLTQGNTHQHRLQLSKVLPSFRRQFWEKKNLLDPQAMFPNREEQLVNVRIKILLTLPLPELSMYLF